MVTWLIGLKIRRWTMFEVRHITRRLNARSSAENGVDPFA